MRVVVFGAGGMLGQAVVKYFQRAGFVVSAVGRSDFDIGTTPFREASRLVSGAELVINCAGIIKPRIAEVTVENLLRVNSIFPKNLAKLCAVEGIRCFHITTDAVYPGNRGRYTEEDAFEPTELYGMSKNGGETPECMTLRTSIIGEEKGRARSLLEWARTQQGKEVNGFQNHLWNGVCTYYLAEIMHNIIRADAYKPGIFHIHSPETLTKFDLLSLINEVYELNLKIRPVNAPESRDLSLNSIYPYASRYASKSLRQQLTEMKQFFASE